MKTGLPSGCNNSHENSQEVEILEGLKVGQKVIVEGNLNLGHDAKVSINEK